MGANAPSLLGVRADKRPAASVRDGDGAASVGKDGVNEERRFDGLNPPGGARFGGREGVRDDRRSDALNWPPPIAYAAGRVAVKFDWTEVTESRRETSDAVSLAV